MEVFCFDFDGVICDSAPETALAAWNAGRAIWPEEQSRLPEELQQRFCRLRPVLHTGYEAIPLMRLIREGEAGDEEFFANFAELRDAIMARENLSMERLKELFGDARDRLIAEGQADWLNWNRFYPDIRDILVSVLERHPVYIITTKQERFVTLLLDYNKVQLPGDKIYGLEKNMSKPNILAALMNGSGLEQPSFHFIEDRIDTLNDVIATPALKSVRLYLADWGYNTTAQQQQAAQSDRIQVVSLDRVNEIFGLGLVS